MCAAQSLVTAERYPIICEDLRTVRGKVLVQSGPERVGLKGVNCPYTTPTNPQLPPINLQQRLIGALQGGGLLLLLALARHLISRIFLGIRGNSCNYRGRC